jgi:hypothetical protein
VQWVLVLVVLLALVMGKQLAEVVYYDLVKAVVALS